MKEPARRPLGASGIEVSELSLGSWRTFERIPRDQGIAVMTRARELGINFLDDARYNDETGKAPIKTGYSEVVFGDLFRASGWKRDEVILANKLWWEFWPEQDAAAELEASLGRMKLDHLDLAYAERLPDGLSVEEIVTSVNGLVKAGKLRAWGVLNWPAAKIDEAARIAGALGTAPPCAAQLAYSLVRRAPVESPDMIEALERAGASVVASFSLEGGALTGKYVHGEVRGRLTGQPADEARMEAMRAGNELSALAGKVGARPSAMAIAFALLNTHVASVLFGSTAADQVTENVGAIELLARMDAGTVGALRAIGASAPDG